MYNTLNNWWIPNNSFRPDTNSGFSYRNAQFVSETNYKKPIKITKGIDDPNQTTDTNEEEDNREPDNE